MFGTREYLKNNYLYRMAGAVIGIYGNSKEEAMYPFYTAGSDGKPLDGSKRYTVRFAPGQLPPANAFWSLTMYKRPESLLAANPINRYLLNSPMLPQFKKDSDGSYTFYVQSESPGKDKEANWLPAPKGPFMVVCRIYWPSQAALAGKWKQPPMTIAGSLAWYRRRRNDWCGALRTRSGVAQAKLSESERLAIDVCALRGA
jgi:hypothetical protein